MLIGSNTSGPKDPWDALHGEHADYPLRAVVGREDDCNHYTDAAQKAIYAHALPLRKDFSVLDFGCGNGRWSLWFAPRVARVVGVDLSPEMVQAAWRLASEKNVKNVGFAVFKGGAAPFSDNSFDLVNCVWVLKYIPSDAEAVRTIVELSRVTKPGGYIAIIEQVNWSGARLLENEGYFQGKAHYRKPDFYIDAFRECGMHLEYHAITNASPLFGIYSRIRRALHAQDNAPLTTTLRCVTALSVQGDLLTGRMTRFRNGHHFFLFRKDGDAGEPGRPKTPKPLSSLVRVLSPFRGA